MLFLSSLNTFRLSMQLWYSKQTIRRNSMFRTRGLIQGNFLLGQTRHERHPSSYVSRQTALPLEDRERWIAILTKLESFWQFKRHSKRGGSSLFCSSMRRCNSVCCFERRLATFFFFYTGTLTRLCWARKGG